MTEKGCEGAGNRKTIIKINCARKEAKTSIANNPFWRFCLELWAAGL